MSQNRLKIELDEPVISALKQSVSPFNEATARRFVLDAIALYLNLANARRAGKILQLVDEAALPVPFALPFEARGNTPEAPEAAERNTDLALQE